MSKTRKTYLIRLACRCVTALVVLYVYLFHPSAFDVLVSWNFFSSFSVLHILWAVWVVDMSAQLIPVGKRIALGSQKLFLFRFQPRKEAINYEALKAHIVDTTKGAYKVFLIWVGMLGILAVLFFSQILGRNEIFLICVAFYVNGYTTFLQAFGFGFLLWTVVNLWDMIVLDILWFCHDPHFVFKGTEDMVKEYHNYWFHIKGFFIGETLALVVCTLAGLVVQFVL